MSLGQTTLGNIGPEITDEVSTADTTREAPLKAKYQAKIAAWKRQPDILKTTHEFFEGDSRVMENLDPDAALNFDSG